MVVADYKGNVIIDSDAANGKLRFLEILTAESIIIGHNFVHHLQVLIAHLN